MTIAVDLGRKATKQTKLTYANSMDPDQARQNEDPYTNSNSLPV